MKRNQKKHQIKLTFKINLVTLMLAVIAAGIIAHYL